MTSNPMIISISNPFGMMNKELLAISSKESFKKTNIFFVIQIIYTIFASDKLYALD